MAHTHAMTHTETCTRADAPLVPARCPGQSSRASLQLSWTFRTTLLYTSFQPGITCGPTSLLSLLTKWRLTFAVDMSADCLQDLVWRENLQQCSRLGKQCWNFYQCVCVCMLEGGIEVMKMHCKRKAMFFSQRRLAQCTTQTWKEWRSRLSNQTWIHV